MARNTEAKTTKRLNCEGGDTVHLDGYTVRVRRKTTLEITAKRRRSIRLRRSRAKRGA